MILPLFPTFWGPVKNSDEKFLVFWAKLHFWTLFYKKLPLAKHATTQKWSKNGPEEGMTTAKMGLFEPNRHFCTFFNANFNTFSEAYQSVPKIATVKVKLFLKSRDSKDTFTYFTF